MCVCIYVCICGYLYVYLYVYLVYLCMYLCQVLLYVNHLYHMYSRTKLKTPCVFMNTCHSTLTPSVFNPFKGTFMNVKNI